MVTEGSLVAELGVAKTRGQGHGNGGSHSKESSGLHGDSDGCQRQNESETKKTDKSQTTEKNAEKICFQETWCRQTNLDSNGMDGWKKRRSLGGEEDGDEAFIDGHLASSDGVERHGKNVKFPAVDYSCHHILHEMGSWRGRRCAGEEGAP